MRLGVPAVSGPGTLPAVAMPGALLVDVEDVKYDRHVQRQALWRHRRIVPEKAPWGLAAQVPENATACVPGSSTGDGPHERPSGHEIQGVGRRPNVVRL